MFDFSVHFALTLKVRILQFLTTKLFNGPVIGFWPKKSPVDSALLLLHNRVTSFLFKGAFLFLPIFVLMS